MYAIETTPGFIIETRPYGEADKLLSIFTRRFGLVTAVAHGIRLEKSKLRYFVNDYSFGTYSLVHGKELWRLTNAESAEAHVRGNSFELIARVALVLKRLLQGEEAHPELFDCVHDLSNFLGEEKGINEESLRTLESLTMFRILNILGYIAPPPELAAVCRDVSLSPAILDELKPKKAEMNRHINQALRESQL